MFEPGRGVRCGIGNRHTAARQGTNPLRLVRAIVWPLTRPLTGAWRALVSVWISRKPARHLCCTVPKPLALAKPDGVFDQMSEGAIEQRDLEIVSPRQPH